MQVSYWNKTAAATQGIGGAGGSSSRCKKRPTVGGWEGGEEARMDKKKRREKVEKPFFFKVGANLVLSHMYRFYMLHMVPQRCVCCRGAVAFYEERLAGKPLTPCLFFSVYDELYPQETCRVIPEITSGYSDYPSYSVECFSHANGFTAWIVGPSSVDQLWFWDLEKNHENDIDHTREPCRTSICSQLKFP